MKAIKTTFRGPTNSRGARIIATDGDRNRVVISYPYELTQEQAHRAAAMALCAKMKWPSDIATGGFPDCYVHVFIQRCTCGGVL